MLLTEILARQKHVKVTLGRNQHTRLKLIMLSVSWGKNTVVCPRWETGFTCIMSRSETSTPSVFSKNLVSQTLEFSIQRPTHYLSIIILPCQKLSNVTRSLITCPLQSCLCGFSFSLSTGEVESENGYNENSCTFSSVQGNWNYTYKRANPW